MSPDNRGMVTDTPVGPVKQTLSWTFLSLHGK